MKLSRKKIIIVVVIITVLLISLIANKIKISVNAEILNNLKGQVFYTKRVDGVLTLYKADADMKNEKLIYSNVGNGNYDNGDKNDNIIDFCYFPETGRIEFEAVYKGKFSILGIKEGETTPIYIREPEEKKKVLDDYRVVEMDTNYISCKNANMEVYEKKGSIYMKSNGEEKCIKRFIGMYSDKFTGYRPVGLSPDGKYLVYNDLGKILGLIVGNKKQYIMDLETGKSTQYINSDLNIQWTTK